MSYSDSGSNEDVEDSPFDDYGGQNQQQNATKLTSTVKSGLSPRLSRSPSEESQESVAKGSDVGDLPPLFSQQRQMSMQFRDIMTDMQDEEDDDTRSIGGERR